MGSEEEGSGDDTGGGGEGGSTDQLEVISLDVSEGYGRCISNSPDRDFVASFVVSVFFVVLEKERKLTICWSIFVSISAP